MTGEVMRERLWTERRIDSMRETEFLLDGKICFILFLLCWRLSDCKVAGDDSKQDGGYTQSTQLQRDYLLWVKISLTRQQLELFVDDEHLHRSLQQCQDRLKTCLIMQYDISETVLTKKPVFFTVSHSQADLTVQAYSTVVSELVATIKTGKYACEAPDILKSVISTHAKLFIIISFLLSFSASLEPKCLMLASCYGHKRHTQSLCECKCTIDCHKTLLLASFIDIEDLCTLQNAILYRSTSSGYAYIHVHKSTIKIRSQPCA